ncbi:hypothetical protein AKJ09_11036 [Labilithrix luteola]|uniref:Type IV fimbrial biogenesis protein PilY1 n=1 Tax=Labilithrix luteola TaxID=1391654 RepID=A0A0K1QF73_9BACT|nr:hypothetical protein AKJ09_11036 [Labilithrix luteola]
MTFTSALVLLATAVNCGIGDTETGERQPDPGTNVLPEAGPTDALADAGATDARADAAPSGPSCSSAGWCATSLPDADLTLKSIWSLEGRAFATAEGATVGVKVLEWTDAEGKWQYIDDNSQNQTGLARYVSNVWAPSENELYYAVAKGTIVHGTRPSSDKAWTWTSHPLEDHSPVRQRYYAPDGPPEAVSGALYPTLGVWGTGADDVYAWYTNTIYHWKSEGSAAPSWMPEYTADDVSSDTEELFALGMTGANRDDLWFSFVRTNMAYYQGSCPVIVRKTPAGYERISDGRVEGTRCTEALPGFSRMGSVRGWLTSLQTLGVGQVAGIQGGRELVKISAAGDGYSVATSRILSLDPVNDFDSSPGASDFFTSLYRAPDGRLWMGGMGIWQLHSSTGGSGMVVSADDVWSAGGSYTVSTLSLTGAPLEGSGFKIHGTSNTNLWLAGARHALHKTNP